MDPSQTQPRSKRRKRYLEPGSHYVVPRTTSIYQKAAEALSASQPCSSKNVPQTSAGNGGSGAAALDTRSLSDAHGDSDENPDPDDTYGFEESSLSSDSDETADSACDDAGMSDSHVDSDTDREQDEDEFCRLFSDERLPNSDLNVREAMIILMAYSTSAGLNWTNMEKLVGVINLFLGKQILPTSKHLLRKTWKLWLAGTVKRHYYCNECGSIVANPTVLRNGLLAALQKKQSRAHETDLTDITDGKLYKNHMKEASWCDLTVTFNVDGARTFKCSKSSLWPIQCVVNELPLTLRWSNMLLCGLYFGKGHPKMGPFLDLFIENVNKVGVIKWECNGLKLSSKVSVVCCCVDAPARAAVLNMKQFNGYYGCSFCHHKGVYFSGSLKYPLSKDGHMPEPRTDATFRKDMEVSLESGEPSHGIKGFSPLARLPGFDLVWSVCPDYMHNVLEGVAKQLAEIWFGSPGSPSYIGQPENIRKLDHRLANLKPPRWFTRLPRSIKERCLWKASEWKWWALFYAAPCLDGILPRRYHSHMCLLASSLYLLLKDRISREEVGEAMDRLSDFALKMEPLYGTGAMSFNVHQLLHLPKSVAELGPLWSHSAFVFESGNGTLLKLISDANGVPSQISERFVMKLQLKKLVNTLELSTGVRTTCHHLMTTSPPRIVDTRPMGKSALCNTVAEDERSAFSAKLGYVPSQVVRFQRIMVH
ncbi:hypothetical protein MTO96_042135, partial [Rhipicephalus appendiculatus]